MPCYFCNYYCESQYSSNFYCQECIKLSPKLKKVISTYVRDNLIYAHIYTADNKHIRFNIDPGRALHNLKGYITVAYLGENAYYETSLSIPINCFTGDIFALLNKIETLMTFM